MIHKIKTFAFLTIILLSLGMAQPSDKQKAPNFVLKTANGQSIELAKLKGKVVIVNFWATWCPPCRAEIPDFIKVYDSYRSKGVEIIGIALDDNGWEAVNPFVAKAKINYPIVLGNPSVVRSYGNIEGIPTTFFIDKNGYVVDQHIGMLSKQTVEQRLTSLLKNK